MKNTMILAMVLIVGISSSPVFAMEYNSTTALDTNGTVYNQTTTKQPDITQPSYPPQNHTVATITQQQQTSSSDCGLNLECQIVNVLQSFLSQMLNVNQSQDKHLEQIIQNQQIEIELLKNMSMSTYKTCQEFTFGC